MPPPQYPPQYPQQPQPPGYPQPPMADPMQGFGFGYASPSSPPPAAKPAPKRFLKITFVIVLGITLTSIAAQLLYPGGRALPQARLNGVDVGFMTADQISEKAKSTIGKDPKVKLATPGDSITLPWRSLGISLDEKATGEAVTRYDWWERLIPFSLVARSIFPADHAFVTAIDKEALKQFTTGISEDQKAAIEPRITIKDGNASLLEGASGYAFERDKVARQITSTRFQNNTRITLKPDETKPKVSKEAAAKALDRVVGILEKELTLAFSGQTIQPDRLTIGSWLVIAPDGKGDLAVDTDKIKLSAYLDVFAAKYAPVPETAMVTLVDGVETGRTAAKGAMSMDVEKTVPLVTTVMLDRQGSGRVDIVLEPIEPKEKFVRNYTRTDKGLQIFLDEWARVNGSPIGVVVQEIGGGKTVGAVNADKPFVTASTYKMFLAYTVLKKIDEGVIFEDQRTDVNMRVDDCIVEMVLNSTNHCAVALQNLVGWEEVDRMLASAGFKDTKLNNLGGGDKVSTVRDESNFLVGLQRCSLLTKQRCEFLLDIMKQQIYRTGIPAGVPEGVEVANKIGFLDNYIHDVGIIYGPTTTYVLAIMSNQPQPPDLPGLSSRVYSFFED